MRSSFARLVIAGALATVAGFVDVLCVARYGAFPATQTGNIVFIGQAMHLMYLPHASTEQNKIDILYRTAVLLASALGAYAFCVFENAVKRNAVSTAAPIIASLVFAADLLPWLYEDSSVRKVFSEPALDSQGGYPAGKWCVLFVAFALGGVHYLCSPASDGSRLKAVTFAATGHVHKLTKQAYKVTHSKQLKGSDKFNAAQSFIVIGGMVVGAFIAAFCMHMNERGDRWLLAPVALCLWLVLWMHDMYLDPPEGRSGSLPCRTTCWAQFTLEGRGQVS